jgi:hypothetical protein
LHKLADEKTGDAFREQVLAKPDEELAKVGISFHPSIRDEIAKQRRELHLGSRTAIKNFLEEIKARTPPDEIEASTMKPERGAMIHIVLLFDIITAGASSLPDPPK